MLVGLLATTQSDDFIKMGLYSSVRSGAPYDRIFPNEYNKIFLLIKSPFTGLTEK